MTGATSASAQSASFSEGDAAVQPFARQTEDVVRERRFPEYDPHVAVLDDYHYRLNLDAELGTTVTNNVLVRHEDRRSDISGTVGASAQLRSDWGRHEVSLGGFIRAQRYADTGIQDNDTWNVAATARLDGRPGNNIQFGAEAGHFILSRLRDRSAILPLAPAPYDRFHAFAGAVQMRGRFRASAVVDWVGTRFTGTAAAGPDGQGGYPDRDRVSATARIDYAHSGDLAVFVRGGVDWQNFRLIEGRVRRDATAWHVEGGVDVEIPGRGDGQISLGYVQQDYDDPTLRDFRGLTYHARFRWVATRRKTVMLDAQRTLDQTPLVTSAGLLTDEVAVSLDNEFLRNLILTPSVRYAHERYRDAALTYDRVEAGLSARYRPNPHWEATVAYSHAARSVAEGPAEAGYDVDTLSATLTHHF